MTLVTLQLLPIPKADSRTYVRTILAVFILVLVSCSPAFSQPPQYGQYPTISASSIPAPPTSMPIAATDNGSNLVPLDQGGEPAASSWFDFRLIKQLVAGGWLMIPLGICSLVVLSLSLERSLALRRSRVIPRPFVRRFTECVEDGQLSFEEANEICDEFDCPVAEVFQAAIKRWGRPMLEIEQAVMDAGDRVADGLKRFLRVFQAISNVAPLLGLLGTVLGMIESFDAMSAAAAGGNPESLAAGISTALITTASGLFVAIPAYLAYVYFGSKSDQYLNDIDRLCQRVIDCVSAEGLETGNKAKKVRRAA
jgi:biopolymer transport protein ExbB